MNVAHSPESPPPLSHRQILVVYSGLVLAIMLAALDSTIVTTALPTIVGELGGLTQLSWVVTAYLVGQTTVIPLYGKLGDLYGRKGILQGAILLFLAGSILCGLSQTMPQLIFFRWIQGLGGGGLMVTAQAVVGDIVSPRQRGRYQGIFGAVFGLASVAGPLLGGYLTSHWTWRWIFYINLPVGILALLVIARTLPPRRPTIRREIDYSGIVLIAILLTSMILLADLGGTEYSWTSPIILGLGVTTLLALIMFILVEARAVEPVLPLRLFLNRSFTVSVCLSWIVGFSLWGAVTYLPLFLQVVKGASPTESGMQLLPLMGGVLVMSIISGQTISRTGRYKTFPIVGMFIISMGLFLLSRLDALISQATLSLYFLMLGIGLGMIMQVLVVAIQNSVEYGTMGIATSGALLFRLMGGSLGTAVLGTLFTVCLHQNLIEVIPPETIAETHLSALSPQSILQLPLETRALFRDAFSSSFQSIFRLAGCVALFGFLLTWFLPEIPLKHTIGDETTGEENSKFEDRKFETNSKE
ncbi:MAG TPA: MDR family MFS transporter [Planctomicrobium sp.]|nr:MDR family MFS transporter [Planctomicrobium sp.]